MSNDETGDHEVNYDEIDDPFKSRSTLANSPKASRKEYREAANSRGAVSVKCESLRGTSGGLVESSPQPYCADDDEEDDMSPVINAEEDGDLVTRVRTSSRSRQHPAARVLTQQALGRSNTASYGGSEEDESAAGEADARPAPSDSPEWPPHGRAMHSFLDLEESSGEPPQADFDPRDLADLPATPPDELELGRCQQGSQTTVTGAGVFATGSQLGRDSTSRKDMMKYSDSDVVKIKQQLHGEHQSALAAKERVWEEKLRKVESENAALREEKERMLINLEEMKNCVLEYERTLQQVLDDRAKGKEPGVAANSAAGGGDSLATSQTVGEIVSERDQALEDLATVEKAFGDLHRRFEKSKQVIEAVKKNEETLKKCLQETMAKLKRHEQKYQTLKQHAEEKLDQANNEIERIKRQSEAELTRLQAGAKKAELQVQGLDAQLEQKKRENAELAQICDELISKCGNA